MNVLRIFAFAAAAALAPALTGCAEDEYESRDAAYPPVPAAVGYTHSPPPPAQIPPPPPAYTPEQVQVQPQDGQATPPGYEVGMEDAPAAEAGYGPEDQYAETDPSALSDFRSTLDPYGQWVDDPSYGTVWVPSSNVVGQDFAPYQTAGHWTYDDEYTWVSDYDWGWAPFHYGRWVYSSPFGWGWIPGRTYAGAWVNWRYGYGDWGYVGWGPMAPTWCWRGGAAVGLGFGVRTPYGFVGNGDLFSPNLHEHLVGGGQAGTIASHTRPYTGASPSVNGRIGANPRVNGPPPSTLGIPASGIAHGGSTNRGVMQARAFAHPSTAMAMGGRAPQGGASRAPAYGGSSAYGRGADPHFGGKLGGGFRGSALNTRPGYGGYSMGSRPYYGAAPGSRGAYSGYGGYRGAPGGFGAYRGGFGGGYRPGMVPNGGSSGHRSYGEESSGGFHGGGGSRGGGFHGGGGGHGGGGRR